MKRAIKRIALACVITLGAMTTPYAAEAQARLSDAAIKQRIIQQSIASYPGNCPCPYNSARNGSSCGGRSAYSRGGGYAPMCYPADVSKEQVNAYRAGQ